MDKFFVEGVVVKPLDRDMFGARICVEGRKIVSIEKDSMVLEPYIMPGFIDAHIHIESSMLVPSKFAELAVKHGTVGVVTDPHEVANVAGEKGVQFMIDDSKRVPVKFFFGVPSCVPASPLEKSGAVLNANDVERMLADPQFYFLAEMMNFPGVLANDPEVMGKLEAAKRFGKPIDGHAPGLRGSALSAYVSSGISTDHECSTAAEGLEKINLGQLIQIREGSAARNFNSLSPLLKKNAKSLMFCTDDCHPDYLVQGHINKIVAKAISEGYDLYDVLTVSTHNPVKHYNLPVGQLAVGDDADFILVDDLVNFNTIATYIDGVKVYGKEKVYFTTTPQQPPQFAFRTKIPEVDQLKVVSTGFKMNVIEAIPGELLTNWVEVMVERGQEIQTNTSEDLLKIVLLDRYSDAAPVVAFIKGFGLQKGSIAASIAHDSHHILAVGVDDLSIQKALQWIVENKGGLCFANHAELTGIKLPFFGLMTNELGEEVSIQYEELNKAVLAAGCKMKAPFMTASFMALTVIPNLKINHNGLFDINKFTSVPLFY